MRIPAKYKVTQINTTGAGKNLQSAVIGRVSAKTVRLMSSNPQRLRASKNIERRCDQDKGKHRDPRSQSRPPPRPSLHERDSEKNQSYEEHYCFGPIADAEHRPDCRVSQPIIWPPGRAQQQRSTKIDEPRNQHV